MGPAERDELSRITTVVPGTNETIGKLVQQLQKLVDLYEVRGVGSKYDKQSKIHSIQSNQVQLEGKP